MAPGTRLATDASGPSASTTYRRTPLPGRAQTPLGWLALCIAGVVFSPFVGFTIHGKVDAAGVVTGLAFAVLPLAGLAAIAVRRWQAWRNLPARVADEWTKGKLVTADGAPRIELPARFSDGKHRIELLPEGVVLSREALLAIQGCADATGRRWIAEQAGELFVAWNEVVEWVVDTDSDAPDYHLLELQPRGAVRVRRFKPSAASECDLLDAVRSAGRIPVRVRCDVECE